MIQIECSTGLASGPRKRAQLIARSAEKLLDDPS